MIMADQAQMSVNEFKERNGRSKKMLLWVAMGSMFMMFAGLTSAYVVSTSRPDWLADFKLPVAFLISTLVIAVSSFTFHLAKKAIKEGKHSMASSWLLATLALGITFIATQFWGFSQVVDLGYYFTGSVNTTVNTTFLYVITLFHLVHLFAGLIVLLVVIYNHFKHKYTPTQTLGIELGAMFWHFVDLLWVYLFLFFYFY